MGLEYTAVHPGKVSNLICLNGTHGHIIDSALQPIFRMPWVGGMMSDILAYLKYSAPWIRLGVRAGVLKMEPVLRQRFDANPDMEWLNWQWLLDIVDVSKAILFALPLNRL